MWQLQSIIFEKKYWDENDAEKWLSERGFKTFCDEKEHFWRYRQIEPVRGAHYMTIKRMKHMLYVMMDNTK
jgi:hypothetical protein